MKPLLAALLVVAAPVLLADEPRPITKAERAALTAVARYLDAGPQALYDALALEAPLRRLPTTQAIAEIAARTGPVQGATWTLETTTVAEAVAFRVRFPSGAEDALFFRMTDGGIAEIVSIAEPETKGIAPNPYMQYAQVTLLFAGLFLLLGTTLRSTRVGFLSLAGLGAAATVGLVVASRMVTPFVPLRELVPLREAMARGDDANVPDGLSDAARDVAHRWMRPLHKSMAQPGSRDANTYYQQAAIAMMQKSRGTAADAFRTAWALEPIPREEVIRNPLFYTIASGEITELHEKPVVSKRAATDPMPLPKRAAAALCGEYLRVEIGGARLEIPNGAPLAPPGAKFLTPTEWHRLREEEVLRDAERLLADPKRKWSYARRDNAAFALAKRNRWDDFLVLTADTELLDPELIRERVTALLRRDRLDEARALAGGKVVQQLVANKSEPMIRVALGDAMVTAGSYDVGRKLYQSVTDREFATLVAARLRSVDAREKLAVAAMTHSTKHFDVRYDATVERETAEEIGRTLETMYAQIEAKLPPSNFRRVAVSVLSAQSFVADISGSSMILGLYDGEILLPYVQGSGVTPEFAAVITHELSHAVVAAATTDNAPRWFQEGLAQYLEPGPRPESHGGVVPLHLQDVYLTDPKDMERGYRSALRFVRYLDQRHPGSIHGLIRAFKQGKNTNEALLDVTGRTADALSDEFLSWRPDAPAPAMTAGLAATTQLPERERPKVEIRWSRRP